MHLRRRFDADDRLLSALRACRAVHEEEEPVALAERFLEVLATVTGATFARVDLPRLLAPISRGAAPPANSEPPLRLEVPFDADRSRATLELWSPEAFDAESTRLAEIIGGELVLAVERADARERAAHSARQLDLVRALTRSGTDVLDLAELADATARELTRSLSGAHVALHVLRDGCLELISRHFPGGSRLDTAPEWLRRIPVDGPLIQAVAARERRIVARTVEELSPKGREALEPLGVRQVLVAPLLDGESVVGVLVVAHRSEARWGDEGLALLESTAARLATAVVRLRVLEEERRRAREIAIFNELGASVARSLNLGDVLTTAVHQLARISAVPRVHVFLPDETRTTLESAVCTRPELRSLRFPVDGPSAVARAFRDGAPAALGDAQNDERADRATAARTGARAILCVPLAYQGKTIGVLTMVESTPERAFSSSDVERATAVANLLAPAITNAKMFDDLRRSYEALGKAQAEIVKNERLAALGELSAVIAHEVRNPLAVIFNSVGSLRRIVPSTEEGELLLDIIEQEGTRLNRIVGDLLDFVRPYTCHPRPGRLDVVVAAAVEVARRSAPDSDVRVDLETTLCAETVVFDEMMLQQALLNLIVNAMQATPRGSRVKVRARTECEGGELRFRCDIVDEGPGVDPADARIFEPFFTTKPTGTGLGLAIVRRIASALGGSVHVERGEPRGSIFTLIVPLAPAPSAS